MTIRCLLAALLLIGTAHAETPTDLRWQFGLRVGTLIPDTALDPTDGRIGIFSLRRALDKDQDLEIEAGYDELDFGINYNLRHRFVGLNYLRVNREPLWDPYVLFGLGGIRYNAPVGETSGNSIYASVGLGGRWELKPEGFYLRAEARMRYDLLNSEQPGQDGFGDGVVTVGLELPLGR
jgi:hypothetical protein